MESPEKIKFELRIADTESYFNLNNVPRSVEIGVKVVGLKDLF